MKIISGIRPTGRLHLGNYIGSILPAVQRDADVLIAHYHAPEASVEDTQQLYADLRKFFAHEKIKFQSMQFDADLYFRLLQVTPTGLLQHMPQYKEKEKNALMFTYPVLMAHDVATYEQVIVGTDQKPHIEFANDILHKVGLKCPEAIYEGGKIMDLRHPERKMSKSTPESCLFLDDSKEIRDKKIKAAVTTPEGRENLETIYYKLYTAVDIHSKAPASNLDLKQEIIELLDKHLGTA